ncbi:aldo/keto reductase [Nigerium sp.]|uniref:aldo/keto reductase n=1 Tax=Nigerium sp. TaxID=2042655 RepID=UPI003221F3BA
MEFLTLNNGVEMPSLGLGVFQSSPEDTADAVAEALRVGYRHIDTAAAYGNEKQVGEGIRRSGLARDEVFVETKVWVSDYGFEQTRHAFEKASAKLGLDQIDLLILHQPAPLSFDSTLEAYRGLESLLDEGRVRAIGVSNFMVENLDALMERATVTPAVNQIEVHPYFQQRDVQARDAELGIVTQAWSPLGGITFYPGWGSDDRRSTLDDPTIGANAKVRGKSPAQVMLRWHLQEGRQVIPKSVKPQRIAENLNVFDFRLTDDEIASIDGLDTGVRGGPDPRQVGKESFDFTIPEA